MRAAYALATVFFFLAPASNASLPPPEKLMKELHDDEQSRLYDNPMDFKAAAKVVIDEPRDEAGLAWSRFDQGVAIQPPPVAILYERAPPLFNGQPQKWAFEVRELPKAELGEFIIYCSGKPCARPTLVWR